MKILKTKKEICSPSTRNYSQRRLKILLSSSSLCVYRNNPKGNPFRALLSYWRKKSKGKNRVQNNAQFKIGILKKLKKWMKSLRKSLLKKVLFLVNQQLKRKKLNKLSQIYLKIKVKNVRPSQIGVVVIIQNLQVSSSRWEKVSLSRLNKSNSQIKRWIYKRNWQRRRGKSSRKTNYKKWKESLIGSKNLRRFKFWRTGS